MDERIVYPALARPALTCTDLHRDKQTEQMGVLEVDIHGPLNALGLCLGELGRSKSEWSAM